MEVYPIIPTREAYGRYTTLYTPSGRHMGGTPPCIHLQGGYMGGTPLYIHLREATWEVHPYIHLREARKEVYPG